MNLNTRDFNLVFGWVIFAALLLIVGSGGDDLLLTVASTTLIWVILAVAMNVTMGYAHLVNLGIGAWFGVGAYVAGLLSVKHDWSMLLAILAGMAAPALLAVILGPAILRARDLHFAIASLAIGVVFLDLFTNLNITGGAVGLPGIERAEFNLGPVEVVLSDSRWMFALLALIAVLVMAGATWFHRSRLALVMRLSVHNEPVAQSLGFAIFRTKLVVYVASSALAGLAGGLYAFYIQYISPDTFSLQAASFQVFVIIAVGGWASVWAPFAGGLLFVGLPIYLDVPGPEKQMLFGVVLILIAIVAPSGLMPALGQAYLRVRRGWRRDKEQSTHA